MQIESQQQMIIQVELQNVSTQLKGCRINIIYMQSWKDEFLTWDPALYNGTTTLVVPQTDVWTVPFISVQM
jgi:hypothetical protein